VTHDPQKPLWLEMQNVVPTALHQTPTGLILKLGDDLRQDMITLKISFLYILAFFQNCSYARGKKGKTEQVHTQIQKSESEMETNKKNG